MQIYVYGWIFDQQHTDTEYCNMYVAWSGAPIYEDQTVFIIGVQHGAVAPPIHKGGKEKTTKQLNHYFPLSHGTVVSTVDFPCCVIQCHTM